MRAMVVVVTGASGALGAAVAKHLVAKGYKAALFGSERSKAELDALAAEVGGAGVASVVAGDATSAATWSEALPRVERELGEAPTHAVLTAGAWRGGKALHDEQDDATWRAMMDANLETAHRSLRALLPGMVARGRGSIVLIGSRPAVEPKTGAKSAAYAASKAAVVALAQAVAAEVLANGVRVNVVLPSTLDTPANRHAMPKADASKWVTLASAAEVIAFLLSDAARDVSGAAVPIYGRA
jgi:NAD(P)-dependent dehydrogenase (short-subunit alcohol dehydrogenase family)